MSSKPLNLVVYLSKALSTARFWETFRCPMSGWCLIKNLSTSDVIRMHWDSAGDDNSTYEPIKPLHTKPFQVDEGDDIWMSSGVNGTRVNIEIAKYKPVKEEYFIDEGAVENIPYCASGVAVTTTYDLTTLGKGYGTYFQVLADGGFGGGFTGTVEYSSNNGTTYSSPIVITDADNMRLSFEEDGRIVTNIRVTRASGTFSVFYR